MDKRSNVETTLCPKVVCRKEREVSKMANTTASARGAVVKLQERAPVPKAKKYWRPEEREPLRFFGEMEEKDKTTLSNPPFITILQGPFGSGKSSISHRISQRGKGLICPKGMSTAWHPGLARKPDQHNLQSWQKTDYARIESTIVGMTPPYLEWRSWARMLNERPPNQREIISVMEAMIACFWIAPITRLMRVVRANEIDFLFELSPPHADQFVRWMAEYSSIETVVERLTVIEIETPVEIRTKWINQRSQEHPTGRGTRYDNIVRRARIFEGASMPTSKILPPTPYPVHTIQNDPNVKLSDLASQVCLIIERKHAGR